jgi:hypothetical protein
LKTPCRTKLSCFRSFSSSILRLGVQFLELIWDMSFYCVLFFPLLFFCFCQQPTANSQQPTANSQQPTANSQQPTANSQQPTGKCVSDYSGKPTAKPIFIGSARTCNGKRDPCANTQNKFLILYRNLFLITFAILCKKNYNFQIGCLPQTKR